MVKIPAEPMQHVVTNFQYSLCRVVLMVYLRVQMLKSEELSFSTRSVESF